MEINSAYSKKMKDLRSKKIIVRPIRRRGGWVSDAHDSAFMNDGARMGIVVPVSRGNVVLDPLKSFSDKDRELFAKEAGLREEDLNVHVKKNYWIGKTVDIDRNGLTLDLSNIVDFTNYLILRSDINLIAPDWGSRFKKGTYKFALVEEGEEIEEKASKVEKVKEAYRLLGKMDHSETKMKDFLYVYYLTKKDAKRPPKDASLEFLKGEVSRIIEEDMSTFLNILRDENYDTKLLIQKAVSCGALQRRKHEFFVPGADRPIGVLEDVIEYLNDDKNQDFELKLIQQVETIKE